MKPLTKLLTATTLTIVLFSNAAHANDKICDINSKFIAGTYTQVSKIANTRLFDKSGAVEHLRKSAEERFKGKEKSVIFIMANHALDFVDEHYEQMHDFSDYEIKRIGYRNCECVKETLRANNPYKQN